MARFGAPFHPAPKVPRTTPLTVGQVQADLELLRSSWVVLEGQQECVDEISLQLRQVYQHLQYSTAGAREMSIVRTMLAGWSQDITHFLEQLEPFAELDRRVEKSILTKPVVIKCSKSGEVWLSSPEFDEQIACEYISGLHWFLTDLLDKLSLIAQRDLVQLERLTQKVLDSTAQAPSIDSDRRELLQIAQRNLATAQEQRSTLLPKQIGGYIAHVQQLLGSVGEDVPAPAPVEQVISPRFVDFAPEAPACAVDSIKRPVPARPGALRRALSGAKNRTRLMISGTTLGLAGGATLVLTTPLDGIGATAAAVVLSAISFPGIYKGVAVALGGRESKDRPAVDPAPAPAAITAAETQHPAQLTDELNVRLAGLRRQLKELSEAPEPTVFLGEQLRLCHQRLDESVTAFGALRLRTQARKDQALEEFGAQLDLIAAEADRLDDAFDEEAMRLQQTHGVYLRDVMGRSELDLNG